MNTRKCCSNLRIFGMNLGLHDTCHYSHPATRENTGSPSVVTTCLFTSDYSLCTGFWTLCWYFQLSIITQAGRFTAVMNSLLIFRIKFGSVIWDVFNASLGLFPSRNVSICFFSPKHSIGDFHVSWYKERFWDLGDIFWLQLLKAEACNQFLELCLNQQL